MTHTPGPWAVEQPSGNEGEAEVISTPTRTVGWTASTWDDDEGEDVVTAEDKANARLIAAAPELLDAARIALAMMGGDDDGPDDDDMFDVWQKVRAAIAKAEGRE
jgi:hypothetical protein